RAVPGGDESLVIAPCRIAWTWPASCNDDRTHAASWGAAIACAIANWFQPGGGRVGNLDRRPARDRHGPFLLASEGWDVFSARVLPRGAREDPELNACQTGAIDARPPADPHSSQTVEGQPWSSEIEQARTGASTAAGGAGAARVLEWLCG